MFELNQWLLKKTAAFTNEWRIIGCKSFTDLPNSLILYSGVSQNPRGFKTTNDYFEKHQKSSPCVETC